MTKLLPYVFRSIARNKVRTVLTLFGLMVAVGIFCFLVSIESSMERTIDRAAESSLLVVTQKDQW